MNVSEMTIDQLITYSSKATPATKSVERADDACRKVVGLLLASGPSTAGEIRRELLDQCLGVDTSNVQAVYVKTMGRLVRVGTVERETDGNDDVFDFTEVCFDTNGNYCGLFADDDV